MKRDLRLDVDMNTLELGDSHSGLAVLFASIHTLQSATTRTYTRNTPPRLLSIPYFYHIVSSDSKGTVDHGGGSDIFVNQAFKVNPANRLKDARDGLRCDQAAADV